MSTTTNRDLLTSAQPWSLYREIHKAMRFALFGITTMAGSADATDGDAVDRLCAEWNDVRAVLLGHHAHEDTFCDPLIAEHVPGFRESLESAHELADSFINGLHSAMTELSYAPNEPEQLLHRFHLDLADFTSLYLDHLRFEEDEVMPALNLVMSNDELKQITLAIRSSVPPAEMCRFIRYMAPAMNAAERVDLLAGLHACTTREVFELFRGATEACLSPADYAAIAIAADFA